VSFTYGLNGFRIPDNKWWLVNVIEAERIIKQAKNARDRGAEFVIVSLHWGEEYRTAPTDFQRDLARRVLGSPAIDAVIGHHAHVVQPITTVRQRFVVYGMGNHVSAQYSPVNTQDGLMVKLLVEERDTGRFVVDGIRVTPTYVERGTYRILPVARTLRAKWPSESLRATLRASWDRTMSAVHSLGRDPRVKPSSYPPK
jgi:poly-gamma-glutamate synthesis protein (capsule biosynthesis protein)